MGKNDQKIIFHLYDGDILFPLYVVYFNIFRFNLFILLFNKSNEANEKL